MIHVDRTAVDVPPVLQQADDKKKRGGRASGDKEQRRARESLKKWKQAGKDPGEWRFDFKIYKHDQIKQALTELFHGKCAYCETRYAATQPMDVEHWRPKGQVETDDGQPKKPAYYWLAATWSNLLPSCIDCNRERKQIDAVTGLKESTGKKDKFPLEIEGQRANQAGQEVNETSLLLNPCEQNPDEFLMFLDGGVLASRADSGLHRRIAETSIQVYGLNRSGLVLNRKEHMQLIELRIATIRGLARMLVDNPSLPKSVEIVVEEIMLAEMRQLVKARNADQPYALAVRQTVDKQIGELAALGIEDR